MATIPTIHPRKVAIHSQDSLRTSEVLVKVVNIRLHSSSSRADTAASHLGEEGIDVSSLTYSSDCCLYNSTHTPLRRVATYRLCSKLELRREL